MFLSEQTSFISSHELSPPPTVPSVFGALPSPSPSTAGLHGVTQSRLLHPREVKGCDQGPAANQCREQGLTPSPCQAPDAWAKGTRAPALGPAGTQGKKDGLRGQRGCRSRFKEALSLHDDTETLQRNFVFRGKEKWAKLFVIHHPPALSTACSRPPLALPFPSSHSADKLYHRVRAVAADNTKTQTFTPQLPAQLK